MTGPEPRRVRALLIDDDPEQGALMEFAVRELPTLALEISQVQSPAEGIAAMRGGHWDIVFVDHRLGSSNGLDLVLDARAEGITLPMVLLSASASWAVDRARVKDLGILWADKGDPPGLLEGVIRRAIAGAGGSEHP
jgi:CheY-like chemotaxis protein